MYTDGGDISFWYSVSSEAGYDKLFFCIDGTELGAWDGEEPYSPAEYSVDMGMHTFRWIYIKDEIDVPPVGDDTCWIDDITFPGGVDTDGDGMPDGWEIDNGLRPMSNDSNKDPDGDGCNNKCEYEADTDPHVIDHIPEIKADFNHDGDVDGSDLALFAEAYATSHADADLNEDGSVNSKDLEIFAENYGNNF